MPSRFEPCGMNQMYSQRYGTLPVAHATGGLADTIVDTTEKSSKGTGFLFANVTVASLLAAIKRALKAYRDPLRWRKLQVNAMAQDFGWEGSAREYAAIFERVRKG
jgi:starch synthase